MAEQTAAARRAREATRASLARTARDGALSRTRGPALVTAAGLWHAIAMVRSVLDLFRSVDFGNLPDPDCEVVTTGAPERGEIVVAGPGAQPDDVVEHRLETSGIRRVIRKRLAEPEFGLFDRLEVVEFYTGSRNAQFSQSAPTPNAADRVQAMLREIYAVPGYETADEDDPVELTEQERFALDRPDQRTWQGRSWLGDVRPPHPIQLMADRSRGLTLMIASVERP